MMGINGIYNPGFAQADGSSKSVSARDGKGNSASLGACLVGSEMCIRDSPYG